MLVALRRVGVRRRCVSECVGDVRGSQSSSVFEMVED
jgi:hypothetical protein